MKAGDILIKGDIERVVDKVYTHHYIWHYPEFPAQKFDSRNSNDPSGVWWNIKTGEKRIVEAKIPK